MTPFLNKSGQVGSIVLTTQWQNNPSEFWQQGRTMFVSNHTIWVLPNRCEETIQFEHNKEKEPTIRLRTILIVLLTLTKPRHFQTQSLQIRNSYSNHSDYNVHLFITCIRQQTLFSPSYKILNYLCLLIYVYTLQVQLKPRYWFPYTVDINNI